MKKIRCVVFGHDWFWWRLDANFRYCRRCRRWEHVTATGWRGVLPPRV